MRLKPIRLLFMMTSMLIVFSAFSNETKPVLIIITNKNVDVTSLAEVRGLYTLKQKYLANDKRAQLTTQFASSDATFAFTEAVFGLYPYQLQRIWDTAVFSGRGKAPRVYNNQNELIEYMINTENTIGYALVSAQQVEKLKESVNVFSITK